LYPILKNIDSGQELNLEERKWLQSKKMHTLLQLDEGLKNEKTFSKLKELYKATAHPDTEVFGELFNILAKIASCDTSMLFDIESLPKQFRCSLSEQDINWLTNEGLTESANIAQRIHFKFLKSKYQVIGQLPVNPFYEIMLKIEREERLDPKQVVQLSEEGSLSRHGKIAIAYYRLEAIFYEKEYQRTGNRWNLPSASANWRKADKPSQALRVTEDINWSKVKENDLKSALFVTRGAAFRDLEKLDEAEKCASQAIECQPNNHQPYTLMGAICYDRGQYADGDKWFSMAIERGADDTDDEIKRIVRMTKDKEKRREVIEYLLNKDKKLYAWADSYLKE
jgi:tetratricopeptide (TPR) repeat protein